MAAGRPATPRVRPGRLTRPGRLGLWTVFRFNPHVLVLLATVLALFYVAREAIPSFIFWRYGPTYRQVDFVMDRAQENDGSPIDRASCVGALQIGRRK